MELMCRYPLVTLRWETKFARFVRHYGVARLARTLEIDPAAIYQWIRGSVSPRPANARIIVALAHNLTLEDIYRHREIVVARSDVQLGVQEARAAPCDRPC